MAKRSGKAGQGDADEEEDKIAGEKKAQTTSQGSPAKRSKPTGQEKLLVLPKLVTVGTTKHT